MIYIGTRRNPLLFEFTSTAPTVLGSRPSPSIQTAVDDFMDLLSTTQLGFQRTIGVKDIYIPGTVPERLYKQAAKAHELNDNSAFILTPDVYAPTTTEVKAV